MNSYSELKDSELKQEVPQPILIEHTPNFNSFWEQFFVTKTCS